MLNGHNCTIELIHSKLSGKKQLFANGQEIAYEETLMSDFKCPFIVGKTKLLVVQVSSSNFNVFVEESSLELIRAKEQKETINHIRDAFHTPGAPRREYHTPQVHSKPVLIDSDENDGFDIDDYEFRDHTKSASSNYVTNYKNNHYYENKKSLFSGNNIAARQNLPSEQIYRSSTPNFVPSKNRDDVIKSLEKLRMRYIYTNKVGSP